jgi:hypothetical protein
VEVEQPLSQSIQVNQLLMRVAGALLPFYRDNKVSFLLKPEAVEYLFYSIRIQGTSIVLSSDRTKFHYSLDVPAGYGQEKRK